MKPLSIIAAILFYLVPASSLQANWADVPSVSNDESSATTTSNQNLIGEYKLVGFTKSVCVILENKKVYMLEKKHQKMLKAWVTGDKIQVSQAKGKGSVILSNLRTGQKAKAQLY